MLSRDGVSSLCKSSICKIRREPPSGGSVVWDFGCLVIWLDLLGKRPDDNIAN